MMPQIWKNKKACLCKYNKGQCSLKISAEKLQEHWEEALSHVSQRKTQLDDMLLECRQFDEMHAEFERWLGQIEEDLHANPVRASGTNIDQQIAKQKVRVIHSVNRK